MIDAATVPAEKLRFTTRLLRDELLRRGWKVWLYYIGSSHMRAERPDGKVVELFSAVPPTTSRTAGALADDKFLTHVVLQEAGLPLAETYMVRTAEDASVHAQQFLGAGKTFVVKPLDSGHGNGVTVEIDSLEALDAALARAKKYSDTVILQECVAKPVDVRVACIDYRFVAALVRIPARVKGDGDHTVAQLIDIENHDERRGRDYAKELNVINPQNATLYLGEAINHIPAAGEYVQVLGTANVGTGGETVDVTDDVPMWLRDMAEKAARVMQLASCGVDFLLGAQPKAGDTADSLSVKIVEVNACPALFLHEKPTYGQPRPVIAAYVDYLAHL